MVVFKEGDAIYHSKVLSFYRKEPFELEACYQYPNNIPYLNPIIGECALRASNIPARSFVVYTGRTVVSP